MAIATRPALIEDAPRMCFLLNEIIAQGGSTAHQRPFDADRMIAHYITPDRAVACTLAEDARAVLGFQSLEWADPDWKGPMRLSADWAVIASFVTPGQQGRGIGQRLWATTRAEAVAAGVRSIDATIRADNVAGLRYYGSLGFMDYGVMKDVPLRDGTRVDRIRKRLDLA